MFGRVAELLASDRAIVMVTAQRTCRVAHLKHGDLLDQRMHDLVEDSNGSGAEAENEAAVADVVVVAFAGAGTVAAADVDCE